MLPDELHVLFDLIVYDHEIIEVLDLWTLNHNRLPDVHELGLSSADDEAAFEPADCA